MSMGGSRSQALGRHAAASGQRGPKLRMEMCEARQSNEEWGNRGIWLVMVNTWLIYGQYMVSMWLIHG